MIPQNGDGKCVNRALRNKAFVCFETTKPLHQCLGLKMVEGPGILTDDLPSSLLHQVWRV